MWFRKQDKMTAPRVTAEMLTEMAKHLRQINFYFLLACGALLLAVYLPRDTTLDKASTQLEEVIRFQSELGDEQLWEVAGTAPPDWVGQRKPHAAVLFSRTGSALEERNVCFIFENEILPGNWLVSAKDNFRQVETHEEFSQLWDSLAEESAYLRIKQYAGAAYYGADVGDGADQSRQMPVQIVMHPDEVQRLYEASRTSSGQNKFVPTLGEWVVFEDTIGGTEYTMGIQLARSMQSVGGPRAIILPVAVEPAKLPMLNRLLDRTDEEFEYLSANHYDLVHRELFDWTLTGQQGQLGLYALQSSLNELRVAQGEKFDVFGFGVPYEFMFQYGLLVLVVVEVFFWGHLRSFRMLAAGFESQVWAPWLPLYPNRLCRALTFLSLFLFPVSVIINLVMAADFSVVSVLAAAGGAIVAALIWVEFFRFWRFTRAVAEKPALVAIKSAA